MPNEKRNQKREFAVKHVKCNAIDCEDHIRHGQHFCSKHFWVLPIEIRDPLGDKSYRMNLLEAIRHIATIEIANPTAPIEKRPWRTGRKGGYGIRSHDEDE